MSTGPLTRISDVIVPEIFNQYTIEATSEKTTLIQSGVIENSPVLSQCLSGGGNTFNFPFFNDLDNDPARAATDGIPAGFSSGTADPDPMKISAADQVAVRILRNQSWGSSNLAGVLAGADPLRFIADRVAAYWSRQLGQLFISTAKGLFANNAASPTAGEHVKNDMTIDIKGTAYDPAKTVFNGQSFIDAVYTMGDSVDDLTTVMVHSVVAARIAKENLIQTIRDSDGRVIYRNYMGARVIVNDTMPSSGGVYESWIFKPGAFQFGTVIPSNATAVEVKQGAGNGNGAEILYNRVHWCLHPVGHQYSGASGSGEPTNTTLEKAPSWKRVFRERKQIGMARLITREAAA